MPRQQRNRLPSTEPTDDIGCGCGWLIGAMVHGHEIRSRFTVLDLARMAGIMPDAAEEIIDTWA